MEEAEKEEFTVTYDGPALDEHLISAHALAQSLLALDAIARKAAASVYPDSDCDIKIRGGFRPGSFNVDLVVDLFKNETVVGGATVIGSAVAVIVALVGFIKFLKGKQVKAKEAVDENNSKITNYKGDVRIFNNSVINIYEQAGIKSQIDRLTGPLDADGVDSISIKSKSTAVSETLEKADRAYLKQGEGTVLSDNEAEVILEVIGPLYDGSAKGWKFSDGEDSSFTAAVEDQQFLNDVKTGKYPLGKGTMIKARLRTVQRKVQRVTVDRTVLEVKEVIPPAQQ